MLVHTEESFSYCLDSFLIHGRLRAIFVRDQIPFSTPLCLLHRSWSTTYDDLLSTSERFPQRIPLSVRSLS